MEKVKNQQVKKLQVTEGLAVTIIPNSDHEFLMSTKDVATGYSVSEGNIRNQLHRNSREFQEGKHFGTAVCFSNSELDVVHNKVFWTKRGIVRLGFFIKSERARLFRDWAEDLVINKVEKTAQGRLFETEQRALPKRRRHNRLTSARLISIMADVAKIENHEVRMNITQKLMSHA